MSRYNRHVRLWRCEGWTDCMSRYNRHVRLWRCEGWTDCMSRYNRHGHVRLWRCEGWTDCMSRYNRHGHVSTDDGTTLQSWDAPLELMETLVSRGKEVHQPAVTAPGRSPGGFDEMGFLSSICRHHGHFDERRRSKECACGLSAGF